MTYDLPGALARRGLRVEVVPGWQTRGVSDLHARGAVCHWTAGPRGATGRPSLNVVVNGRPGLSGPLCNVYLDRNGVAVVVAARTAQHAGQGGWRGLVGNSSVFGTEGECGGDGDWTDAQRWAYPRVCAAYCDLGGFGVDMVCGHEEWAPTRKIDIRDYTMPVMRAQVAALLANPEDDMPLSPDDLKAVAKAVWSDYPIGKRGGFGPANAATWLQDARIGVAGVGGAVAALAKTADVDESALAAALVGPLTSALVSAVQNAGGLTQAQAEAACEEAVRNVLGSVGNRPA